MPHKILIVDDETMITELLSDHLRDCGYDTMTAGSSENAESAGGSTFKEKGGFIF